MVSLVAKSAQTAGRMISVLTTVRPAGAGSYSPTSPKCTLGVNACQASLSTIPPREQTNVIENHISPTCLRPITDKFLAVLDDPAVDINHMTGINGNLSHAGATLQGFERLDSLLKISGSLAALPDQ